VESKTEQYRRKAEEAERHAEDTCDYGAQRTWREVAIQWREMAQQAERNGW
jgi:hypothetical protein